ncbi:RNA-guided endonuclease IscB [Metabacillus rhizolycopersici]|uniref:HNH endonuclease n=1 Tax=Metabacillus rhizolycopersici TaxID=2875709 RepID=A0ABS7UUM9_9BACI|nr:RNA-guided endonuclease IscB [Metabacillus rhizolycopersici]MBZ5751924.1 HNH endonuclease [Metabacillus rhizolycopersici]
MVYVLNVYGKPLMPCSSVIARLLLKQGKAKVKGRTPFTIQLLYKTETEYVQSLTHGLDSGSAKVGSAVSGEKGNIVYMAQIETRYRKARWLNRKNSMKKDRFSPTMTSKIHAHVREMKFVQTVLPISKTIIETATFDPHALKNPAVLTNKWLYQKGINYGYANTKAYVLTRDGYCCQHCKGKTKDKRLEVHHIIFRSENGSDEEDNLLTLCKTCHDALHRGEVALKKKGKKKGKLNHATQMNSIGIQLLKRTHAEETFGFVTKEHRQLMRLPKEHYFDAVAITTQGKEPTFKTSNVLFKKCVSYGDYQQTKGVRSEQVMPTGKLFGFRKFDKVQYKGNDYFIKGRMSTGYAILMDTEGNKVDLKPIPKFSKMKRVSARKSWMTIPKIILSFYSCAT